jgi:hypothetical protein
MLDIGRWPPWRRWRVGLGEGVGRTNLAPVVLQIKALGVDNVARFDFLSPPPASLLMRALEVRWTRCRCVWVSLRRVVVATACAVALCPGRARR